MTISRRMALRRVLLGSAAYTLLAAGRASAEVVQYTYDALGRLASVTYSDGSTITYTYDAAGNRTALVQTGPTPVGALFDADPTVIPLGGSSSLIWTTTNATAASIDNGVGNVTPVAGGSVPVSPSTTTIYKLTATGPTGSAVKEATVTVVPPPGINFSASPGTITQGNSSTLSWTTTNAASVSIDQGIGAVPLNGSLPVSPLATTTYKLTAVGQFTQSTSQTTVTVNPGGFVQTIQVAGLGVNLRSLADAAGYNGAQHATVTFEVANGVTVTGGGGIAGFNGGIAIDTGTWPTASYSITLALVVKTGGIVRGGGGCGGNGGDWGGAGGNGSKGGDAIYCRAPISITFESGSEIRGGGGGGGGGASAEDGWPEPQWYGGGGGGGGAPNGGGGTGGFGDGGNGTNGSSGTTSGGGAYGDGPGPAGRGGTGGAYAAVGENGNPFLPLVQGGSGGAGGYCVRKNGHTVPVTNNGSTSGTIG